MPADTGYSEKKQYHMGQRIRSMESPGQSTLTLLPEFYQVPFYRNTFRKS